MNLQHGDILLKSVQSLPEGVKPKARESGGIVVMRGEQTGHNHIITADKAVLYELKRNGKTELYLEVAEPVTITHDEHKPIEIPEGIYQIGQVQEHDYFEDMARQVRD